MSALILWSWLLVGGLLAGPGFCQPTPPAEEIQILVQAGGAGAAINRKLLGHNVMVAGNGMWDARLDSLEPEAARLILPLQPPVLRFPGGSIANFYIWEDGLGVPTTSPLSPDTQTIILPTTPNLAGVTRIRLIDRHGGKYGDLAAFERQNGASLSGIRGWRHTHPAGADLRPERRPGQPEWHSNSYGLKEHLKLCEAAGAVPLLTVNAGTGLTQDGQVSLAVSLSQRLGRAVAWVAYLNGDPADTRSLGRDEEGNDWLTVGTWARRRVEHGHPQPYNVTYWEIGNEVYDRHEMGFTSARQYGQDFVRFAQAMKAVDPNIKIGAVGMADPHSRGDADPDQPWNATVLDIARQHLDFLVLHLYYPSAPLPYQSRTWFAAVMGAASQALQHLREIRSLIDASGERGRQVKIVVSEYGLWPAGSSSGRDFSNLARALSEADLLLGLIGQSRELGVELAAAWNLHGNNPTAALRFDFGSESRVVRPQYFVYRLFQSHLGATRLPVGVSAPTTSIPPLGNVKIPTAIPLVQVLATMNEKKSLNLWVLNRSLERPVTAVIRLQDYQPQATARISRLWGASPGAHNEAAMCQVTLQTQVREDISQTFHQTFAPHSLTVLELLPASASP